MKKKTLFKAVQTFSIATPIYLDDVLHPIIFNNFVLIFSSNLCSCQLYDNTSFHCINNSHNKISIGENGIGGVMVSMLASSVVYCGVEPLLDQTICCFSAKHTALRSKSKDWLARNQNNVSEWRDLSTRGLLFQ